LQSFAPTHFTCAVCALIALGLLMDEVPCAIAVPAMNIIAAAEANSAPFFADFILPDSFRFSV
jgi:hypothetical protein